MEIEGFGKGDRALFGVQEEYSLVLKVGRQDHSQGAWESIGLYEVEELGVWKGGGAPFLGRRRWMNYLRVQGENFGCRRWRNHPGVQGRIPRFEPGSPAFLSSPKNSNLSMEPFIKVPRKAGILDRTRLRELKISHIGCKGLVKG